MTPVSSDVSLTCPDCGFVTKPTSLAYAEKSLRVHSCERFREATAIAQRKAARAADSGVSRPCTHLSVTHEHGDYLRYVSDRCRCRKCRDAVDERSKGKGRSGSEEGLQPVRGPIAGRRTSSGELLAAGMSMPTGRTGQWRQLRDGAASCCSLTRRAHAARRTARRLMAVQAPVLPAATPLSM
jgi:hypothetical protein